MRGSVEVYQGFCRGDSIEFSDTPIHVDNNLIVEGAKEHIVDMLTWIPSPSSILSSVSSLYDVSNFIVHGTSVSPNKSAFLRCQALAAVSGYQVTGSPGVGFVDLDPSDGTAWSYLPDFPNFSFSSINGGVSGSKYPNSVIQNPTFSSVTNVLSNSKFRDYSIDDSLTGVHLNIVLGLYELSQWDIRSTLRYVNKLTEYSATPRYGSLARHDIKDVSTVSSIVSAGYAEPDDGVLYVRSFSPSDEGTTSGAVNLSQQFVPYVSGRSPQVRYDESLGSLAEISAKYHSISGGADACILVYLQDKTTGERYDFSGDRHEWNFTGFPLVFDASKDTSSCISFFVNITNTRMSHKLELTYQFASHDNSDILECYFWDAGVSFMDGWLYGNLAPNDSMFRVVGGDYTDPGVFMTTSGSGGTKGSALPLSSVSYLSQVFSMSPLKKYGGFIFGGLMGGATAIDHYLDVGVLKKSTSQSKKIGKYNYLTYASASDLIESNLGASVAASPRINSTIPWVTNPQHALKLANSLKPKPSELCLEVVTSSTLSGLFELPLNKPAVFEGAILKKFRDISGVSGSDVYFTLHTSGIDSSGNHRYFDFTIGDWNSLPAGASIPDRNKFFTSSVSTGSEEYASFRSTPLVNSNLLLGLVPSTTGTTGTAFSLILKIHNETAAPAFIKNLRMDSYAKTYAEDIHEYFSWSALTGPSRWTVQPSTYSGQYVLSGISTTEYTETKSATGINGWGLNCLDSMNLASGSTHTSETEYQLVVFNTRNNNLATGGFQRISCAAICDVGLMPYTLPVGDDVWTSESYLPVPRFELEGSPTVQYFNDVSNIGTSYSSLFPGVTPISPTSGGWSLWDESTGFLLGTYNAPVVATRAPIELCRTFKVGDVVLPVSSTEIAFSLKYQQMEDDSGGKPETLWTALAQLDSGDLLYWDADAPSGWKPYEEAFDGASVPYNDFSYTFRRGFMATDEDKNIKRIFSTKVLLTDARFTPTTKIRFAISQASKTDWDASNITAVKDWEFYRISPYPVKDLPVFPSPLDRTLQPVVSGSAGLLGQYVNYINWPSYIGSSLSGISEDRAHADGGWLAGSGITLSGDSLEGSANKFAVINSDGMMYPVTGTGRPVVDNGGLALSGFQASSNVSSVTYWFDIGSDDITFFDFQGGIGAVGLWVLDVEKTYDSLHTGGYDVTALYDSPGPRTGNLYNVNDSDRNLVYKLFSKKVFRTPVSIGGGGAIRIKWKVIFLP